MANKNPQPSRNVLESTPKKGSILKKLLIVFVIIMVGGVGFALGVYLKLIDPQAIAAKMKLYEYPVIGQYFTPPKTNFEPVELENAPPVAEPTTPETITPPAQLVQQVNPTVTLNNTDKLAKARQQEETKKISKLARLYENMKPEEVVPIMDKLEDDTVIALFNKMDEGQVAKIMALFDADRAARLSQAMLKVQTPAVP